MRYSQTLCLAALLGVSGRCASAQDAGKPAGRHALLVGCTRYPNLAEKYQLIGPGNDVLLMRDLLTGDRFGFPRGNVVILSEAAGGANLPTRAHIEREFRHLARIARRGDQMVILLAGHGSQQPDESPDDPDNYEPDGLDETFFPRDVGAWDGEKEKVQNAIVDNEIRVWLKAITDKGARVFFIADCCHAGTLARGEEVSRAVPVEDLVPAQAVEKARKRAAGRAEKSRGEAKKSSPFSLPGKAPDLVAIYATQAEDLEVEKKLPDDSPDRKYYGLLTYTLNQVLTRANAPLTYAELTQRVYAQYVEWGRSYPIPLVEGKDQDRVVLGERLWPRRSTIRLSRHAGGFKVNAGALHGLTAGSVLAVYPPPGQAGGDRPLGYVRVARKRTLESQVLPCPYEDAPERKDLPAGGRCEVVYTDYGDQRLRLAGASNGADVERVVGELAKLEKAPGSFIQLVESADADWLVEIRSGAVHLVSTAESQRGKAAGVRLTDARADGRLGERLRESLARVARAQSLVRLAGAVGQDRPRGEAERGVRVELLRYDDESDREGKVVAWQAGGLVLRAGDIIGFRITNRNVYAMDVSLLFVDSDHGIHAYFPEDGTVSDNRVAPSKSLRTPRAVVKESTLGLEHMVVIAVKAQGQPMDFTVLAQAPVAGNTRGTTRGKRTLATPLGRLLDHTLYREGKARGLGALEADSYALLRLDWRAVSAEPEDAKK